MEEIRVIRFEDLHDLELDGEKLEPASRLSDTTDLQATIQERVAAGLDPLVEPLLVSENDDGYTLLAGHRRRTALKALGITEARCRVTQEEDPVLAFMTSNVQTPPTPLEMCHQIRLAAKNGYTRLQIASALGISVVHYDTLIDLMKAPDEVKRAVKEDRLSITAYRTFAKEGHGTQKDIVEQATDSARRDDKKITTQHARAVRDRVRAAQEGEPIEELGDPRSFAERAGAIRRDIYDLVMANKTREEAVAVHFVLDQLSNELVGHLSELAAQIQTTPSGEKEETE